MKFKTNPMDHQMKELMKSDDPGRGIFWDMGTGKTWIAIVTIAKWFEEGQIDSAIIFAPKSMMHQWIDGEESEWIQHSPLGLDEVAAYQWSSKKSRKNLEAQANVLVPEHGILDLVVINTESAITDACRSFLTQFYKNHRKVAVILDEASMVKDHTAKRSKVLQRVAARSKFRRALTGTPVTNSPLDMFGVFKFINPDVLGHQYTLFRSEYCKIEQQYGPGGRMYPKVLGYKNLEKLKRIIAPHSTRVLKEDVIKDLPPVSFKTLSVPMGPKQQKIYDAMLEEAIVNIEHMEETSTISATTVLSQLIKLKQIACGFLPDVVNEKYVPISDHTRYKALMEFLDTFDDKTIIWCDFRQNISDIEKLLRKEYGKDSYVTYTGDTKDKRGAQAQFRTNDKCKFFLATVASGNLGLNLVEAGTMVFYSTSYNLGHRLQAQDRFYRKGQTRPVTIWDILAPGTVDVKIRHALIHKRKMADEITDGRILSWLKEIKSAPEEST